MRVKAGTDYISYKKAGHSAKRNQLYYIIADLPWVFLYMVIGFVFIVGARALGLDFYDFLF